MLHRVDQRMKLSNIPAIVFCFVFILIGVSCSDQDSDNPAETGSADSKGVEQTSTPFTPKYAAPERKSPVGEKREALAKGSVNFAEHVAPIVFAKCAQCHRPGESAPFSLLNYRQISKRAKQIVEVTQSGYMPPWVPDRGVNHYHGERTLSNLQIEQLARWAEDECPKGPSNKAPRPPERPATWQEGKPDLILTMPKPFEVRAEGNDVFRTFVFPVPIVRDRYVRAIQIRPLNAKVSHHAILEIDTTPSCRQEDAMTPDTAGYPGMNLHNAEPPPGYFIGWTPSKGASVTLPGLSWKLKKGSDLVLQMHLVATGKVESFAAEIGLYFTEVAPTKLAYGIELRSDDINLPAGAKKVTVEDSLLLPVPTKVMSIYPHAHYLGKDFRVFVIHPDGSNSWLFTTKDWDFNWQDDYTFKEPVLLPAGSRMVMQVDFDNSDDNPRNPSSPPKDVRFGLQSTDEMATCSLTIELANRKDLAAMGIAVEKGHVEKHPKSWAAYCNLGRSYAFAKDFDSAIATFRKGIEVQNHPELHKQLANALAMTGDELGAIPHFESAVQVLPRDPRLRFSLALALSNTGSIVEARKHLLQAVQLNPNYIAPYILLSRNFVTEQNSKEAIKVCQAALRFRPDSFDLYIELINVMSTNGAGDQIPPVIESGLAWAKKNRSAVLLQQLEGLKRQFVK